MPMAARTGDPTNHPGVVAGPGVATELIGGMPAATVSSLHTCAFRPPALHPPTPILPPGCPRVLMGGVRAACVGDLSGCGAIIIMGAPTVMIGG